MSLSEKDGETLVKTARVAVTEYLKTRKRLTLPEDFRSEFSYNSGVFVTLYKVEDLRGCIGFPTPERKLYQSLVD
ncbi:MAG: AMMECR1 domain-containing protein, partial [Nitrosopumilaceae archaeon]